MCIRDRSASRSCPDFLPAYCPLWCAPVVTKSMILREPFYRVTSPEVIPLAAGHSIFKVLCLSLIHIYNSETNGRETPILLANSACFMFKALMSSRIRSFIHLTPSARILCVMLHALAVHTLSLIHIFVSAGARSHRSRFSAGFPVNRSSHCASCASLISSSLSRFVGTIGCTGSKSVRQTRVLSLTQVLCPASRQKPRFGARRDRAGIKLLHAPHRLSLIHICSGTSRR